MSFPTLPTVAYVNQTHHFGYFEPKSIIKWWITVFKCWIYFTKTFSVRYLTSGGNCQWLEIANKQLFHASNGLQMGIKHINFVYFEPKSIIKLCITVVQLLDILHQNFFCEISDIRRQLSWDYKLQINSFPTLPTVADVNQNTSFCIFWVQNQHNIMMHSRVQMLDILHQNLLCEISDIRRQLARLANCK